MANPKIQVDLTADAKGLKKGAKEAGDAVEKLAKEADDAADKIDNAGDKADRAGGKFDGLARNKAGEHLGAVGDAADALGFDLDNVDTKVLAAGAGFAALGGVLVGGIQQWGQYTAQVRQYADAAGVSTEEASRFAEVFRQFGIEADDGIDALKTLGEEAGDAPEKFRKYGVEIARANDGSVDLAATMANVAERFRNMKDPAEKAAMGAALFGDNWLRIAPVLEKGKQGLDDLLDSVSESRIVTAEAEAQQREFEQAMRELEGTVQSLQMAIGRDAIPKLTLLAQDLSAAAEQVDKLSGRQGTLNDFISQFNPISAIYNARLREQADNADEAARAMGANTEAVAAAGIAAASATQTTEALAAATDEATKAMDRQQTALLGLFNRELAADEARKGFMETLADLGTATDDYGDKLDDAKGRALSAANAQVELARQSAAAEGSTLSAAEAQQVFRGALEELRGSVADPSLRAYLDETIGRLNAAEQAGYGAAGAFDSAAAAASRLASSALAAGAAAASAASAPTGRATGGMTMADVPYRVGESGTEVFIPQQNGRVLSVPQAQQALAGAMAGEAGAQGGGASVIVVPVYLDGRKIAEATARPNELIRRAGR